MAPMMAIMNTILMDMSKMRKVPDKHTDEVWTMANRSQHKLTCSKAPVSYQVKIKTVAVAAIMDIVTKWF